MSLSCFYTSCYFTLMFRISAKNRGFGLETTRNPCFRLQTVREATVTLGSKRPRSKMMFFLNDTIIPPVL